MYRFCLFLPFFDWIFELFRQWGMFVILSQITFLCIDFWTNYFSFLIGYFISYLPLIGYLISYLPLIGHFISYLSLISFYLLFTTDLLFYFTFTADITADIITFPGFSPIYVICVYKSLLFSVGLPKTLFLFCSSLLFITLLLLI